MLTFIILCAFVVGSGYIVSKLPKNNCNQDCNQGRNCDCKGK